MILTPRDRNPEQLKDDKNFNIKLCIFKHKKEHDDNEYINKRRSLLHTVYFSNDFYGLTNINIGRVGLLIEDNIFTFEMYITHSKTDENIYKKHAISLQDDIYLPCITYNHSTSILWYMIPLETLLLAAADEYYQF